jgi:hypothetical protein
MMLADMIGVVSIITKNKKTPKGTPLTLFI